MEWILIWLVLAVIVGVAANTRGRSGFGWFLLAAIISPFLAGLLVLALGPTNNANVRVGTGFFRAPPKSPNPKRLIFGTTTTSSPGPAARHDGPFIPDGVYSGIPYRVLPGGLVDAAMPSGMVRFRSMDQLLAATSQGTTDPVDPVK